MTESNSIVGADGFEARLPCPVCLVAMEKSRVAGVQRPLTIDHCQRCGGVWFDRGEVQTLAARKPAELWSTIAQRTERALPPCHGCGAPLDRDQARCSACDHANELQCPVCDEPMSRSETHGLTLDVCQRCRGAWFDHHELAAIWRLNLDRAMARRGVGGPAAGGNAMAVGVEALGDAMFWSPDLVVHGAVGAAHLGVAAIEVVGNASESVFEAIVAIIASIFDT